MPNETPSSIPVQTDDLKRRKREEALRQVRIKSAQRQIQHLERLQRYTVSEVVRSMGETPPQVYGLRMTQHGKPDLIVWILRDEEGNGGPGHLDIQRV